MATAFASGSWTRIRWCCHQGDRKTLIKHSRRESPPRWLFAISTNLVNLRAEGKEPHIRSETVRHRKNHHQPQNEPILYYLKNGPKRGFVCGDLLVVPADTELPSPSWHLPQLLLPLLHLHVTLYRLRLDVVLQNPAFVVVRAQPQLFLLMGAHHSFVHSQPSVCGGIYVPLQRFVAPVLVQFVLSFLHRF